MVRRNTRIDTQNNLNQSGSASPSQTPFQSAMHRHLKRYNFKVFRKAVRFKRWRLGITKFIKRRRKYIKRKHKTNSVFMTMLTVLWAINYLQERRVSRFVASLGFSSTSALSADYGCLKELSVRNYSEIRSGGFSAFSTCWSTINLIQSKLLFSLGNNRAGCNVTFTSLYQPKSAEPDYSQFALTGSNAIISDNNIYPLTSLEKISTLSNHKLMKLTNSTLVNNSIKIVSSIRKIIVLLSVVISLGKSND